MRTDPTTPDKDKFKIVDARAVGANLVLKVNYPNCSNCSYEGNKVLVFLKVDALAALKWRTIDPHFRNTKASVDAAPSPAARFPASTEGWNDAMDYAASRT